MLLDAEMIQPPCIEIQLGFCSFQVEETVGFAEDEEATDALVSDERDEGSFVDDTAAEDSAVGAEGQPWVSHPRRRADDPQSLSEAQPLRQKAWLMCEALCEWHGSLCESS